MKQIISKAIFTVNRYTYIYLEKSSLLGLVLLIDKFFAKKNRRRRLFCRDVSDACGLAPARKGGLFLLEVISSVPPSISPK